MEKSRRRAREEEYPADVVRLSDERWKFKSPGTDKLVVYGEVKQYVLSKTDLQRKLLIAEQKIRSLEGHFTYSKEEQQLVKTLAKQLTTRWQKDGTARAVRDRRANLLLTLREKIRVTASMYEKQRKELQVLRAKEQMLNQRVQEDAAIAEAEQHEEAMRVDLQHQANKLKIMQQKAAMAAKQHKIDAAEAFASVSAGGSGAMLYKLLSGKPKSIVAAASSAAAANNDAEDDYAEEETAEEVAQHEAEDAEEERDAMEDMMTEEDRAFIDGEEEA